MNRREFLAVTGASASVTAAGCLGSDDGESDCPNADTDLPYTPACADVIGSFRGYLVQPPDGEPTTAVGDDYRESPILQRLVEAATTTPEDELGGVITEEDVVYRVVTVPPGETAADERESAAETLQRLPVAEHSDLGAGWYLTHPDQTLFVTYGADVLPD